ncbi:MAG: 50S ribosomal protein L22 [Deltaproteobacteria bacterium]|nr:50S ribosomal protein L22 [Deltaproteobacteria bacterium]MBI4223312.1 50S ribosomal protein L22 [Deltaproteobacteria bacterium]
MSRQATHRYLRMAPRKVQKVADAIRGLPVDRAMDYLQFSRRGASKPLYKLLKSALVNAGQEKGVDIDNLRVRELRIGPGPTMKRWMPRARGMATPVKKRTSHITIILGEK